MQLRDKEKVIQALGFLIDEVEDKVEEMSRRRENVYDREKRPIRRLVQTIQYPNFVVAKGEKRKERHLQRNKTRIQGQKSGSFQLERTHQVPTKEL